MLLMNIIEHYAIILNYIKYNKKYLMYWIYLSSQRISSVVEASIRFKKWPEVVDKHTKEVDLRIYEIKCIVQKRTTQSIDYVENLSVFEADSGIPW